MERHFIEEHRKYAENIYIDKYVNVILRVMIAYGKLSEGQTYCYI